MDEGLSCSLTTGRRSSRPWSHDPREDGGGTGDRSPSQKGNDIGDLLLNPLYIPVSFFSGCFNLILLLSNSLDS